MNTLALAMEDSAEYEYISDTPSWLQGKKSWPSSGQSHRLPAVPEEFTLTNSPAYSLTTKTDQERSQLLTSVDSLGYVRTT